MPTVTFSADCLNAYKHPLDGSSIIIPIRCSSDDKSIDVGFYAQARFERLIPESARETEIAALVASTLFHKLSAFHGVNVYQIAEFYLPEFNPSTPASDRGASPSLEITEDLAREWTEITGVHRDSEAAFDRAKQWLRDNIHHLRFDPAPARSAANFLAACLTHSCNIRPWNTELGDRIRYTSEELIGRKDPNHQGYKSRAKRLTGDLGVLDFPSFWSSRPPDASSLDLPAV
jgi:hypothetical protein